MMQQSELDEYILKLKEKENDHVNWRDAIARTVEKKQRELNFLKSLTPDDVIYFDRKKKMYAAKCIWVRELTCSEPGDEWSWGGCWTKESEKSLN